MGSSRRMSSFQRQLFLSILLTIVFDGWRGTSLVFSGEMDNVQGMGCYTYTDGETLSDARRLAMALARGEAVKNYKVFIQAKTTVKNDQIEEDIMQAVSAATLSDTKIVKQEQKDREICITISARVSPKKLEEAIEQHTKADDLAKSAKEPLLHRASDFELKVWTNKQEGVFVEGEPLVVSVQSSRDAYLKLDYYQADGTVVHLTPNLYATHAFVKAGQTVTFGQGTVRESFTIIGPFGSEVIKALASVRPFDDVLSTPMSQDGGRVYLKSLSRGLRGVMIGEDRPEVSPPEAPPAQWAEASVSLTTLSKATFEYTAALAKLRGIKRSAK